MAQDFKKPAYKVKAPEPKKKSFHSVTQSEQWLPNDLEYQVSNFNHLFISKLSQNLTKIMHPESKVNDESKALEDLEESLIMHEHSEDEEDEEPLSESMVL